MISIVSLLLLTTATAHNWVNSRSRAGKGAQASTERPAPPAGQPHLQVIAGQKFQIEHVVGHRSSVTDNDKFMHYTVISAKDSDKMALHAPNLYRNYFDGCRGAEAGIPQPEWANYHLKYNDNSLDSQEKCSTAQRDKGECPGLTRNFFAQRIMPNSPFFIPRSTKTEGRFDGAPGGGNLERQNNRDSFNYDLVSQFKYKDADVVNNRRCSHKDARYPWILSMARFRVVQHQPTRPDIANFEIPAGSPPGRYVVHWSWRGYYDAIDVQLVPGNTAVPAPYGGEIPPNAPPTFQRMDHCDYPDNTRAGACRAMTAQNGMLAKPQACLDECASKGLNQCNGVVVVPIAHPDTVFADFRSMPVNIPFGNGCARPGNGATHVCYPVKSREGTDVEREHFQTKDTEDPAFYSTCYIRGEPDLFGGEESVEMPQWEYRGKCIDCADQQKAANVNLAPVWKIADTCVDCGLVVTELADDDTLKLHLTFDGNGGKNMDDQPNGGDPKFTDVTFTGGLVPGGRAAVFPGTDAAGVDLGAFNVPGNKFSMMAFVRFENVEMADPRIISKARGTDRNDHTFMLSSSTANGKTYPRVRLQTGDTVSELRCTREILNNRVYHIAAVYNGAQLRIFLNGQQCGGTAATGNIPSNNDRLMIGRSPLPATNTRPLKGRIDDVRIYSSALSADQVKAIFDLR